MEEEKNMIKGQEGEAFVIREVGKVANYLGKTIRCFNHVILDFDSVYGSRTAELDHIIICGDKILIGETKNANYVSTEYSEIPWNLMNGKTTDNPIVQNHYHKQIFCSIRFPNGCCMRLIRIWQRWVVSRIGQVYIRCSIGVLFRGDSIWCWLLPLALCSM